MSSNESIIASQEHTVMAASVTLTPAPTMTTVAHRTQVAMKTPRATSTPTPTPLTTMTRTTSTTTTTTVAPHTQDGIKNIVETAEADGRFTTLVTAVKAAGLNDTLSDPDSTFTVFAPTDDAFMNLPTGTMDTLLKDPQGDLLQILLYHVVNGKVMASDLKKLTSSETLQGGSLTISVSSGTVIVDGATVIITDIECSNGVIHVVDTVMLPPA